MQRDSPSKPDFAHYLRFARAVALVGAISAAPLVSGCCPMIPDSIACAHCTCFGQSTTASSPVACTTIRRDTECCLSRMPVPGPLPPPDLPA